jgi:membrane protein DedA with SNARE-associated domain
MEFITDILSTSRYWGIFLFLLSGVFGPPIPDEILLIMVGYWSFGGTFEFLPTLALVITGSLGGTFLNYLVGRFCFYSARLTKMQNSTPLASKVLGAQDLIKRFGPRIAMGCYFLPGFRHWLPVVAGLCKAHPVRLGIGAGLGALLWSSAYLSLGYLLAKNGVAVPDSLGNSPYLAIPGVVLIFLAVWLTRRNWREKIC